MIQTNNTELQNIKERCKKTLNDHSFRKWPQSGTKQIHNKAHKTRAQNSVFLSDPQPSQILFSFNLSLVSLWILSSETSDEWGLGGRSHSHWHIFAMWFTVFMTLLGFFSLYLHSATSMFFYFCTLCTVGLNACDRICVTNTLNTWQVGGYMNNVI